MHITVGSNSHEKGETYKCVGYLLTNQNYTHEEIKCGIKTVSSCYYSVQIILSFRRSSDKLKIKIYKTTIWSVVLHGCEAWLSH